MPNHDAKRLEQLAAEAQYRTQRLALYRARLYGGRAHDRARLAELQRGSDEAKARLTRARSAAADPPPA